MGMLSKKRKVPRIVKKRKRHDKKIKKKVLPQNLAQPDKWQSEKTAKQNYASLGIVMNNKPSMRQDKEGKLLMTEARIRLNQKHYEKQGVIEDDMEAINQAAEE